MRYAISRRRLTSVLSVLGLVAGSVTAVTAVSMLAAPSAAADPSPIVAPVASMVTADALPTAQLDGVGWSQTIIGNTVYVGGKFANARPAGAAPGSNQVARGNLMSYTLSTGAMTSWAPSLNGQVKVVAKSPDGTKLYVGGDFTTADGQTRSRFAAYNVATGALIANFAPSFSGQVKAIVATNTTVFVGGDFVKVNGLYKIRLAALRASDGALLSWRSDADYMVNALALTAGNSALLAGGGFQNVNASPAYGLAKIDVNSGAVLPWNAANTVQNAGKAAAITSLKVYGTKVYGTAFQFGDGGNIEGTFKADADTGTVEWVEDCHGDTYDMTLANNIIYTVSHAHYCGNIGGFFQSDPWSVNMRHALAFTNDATGTIGHDPYGYHDWFGAASPSLYNWFPEFRPGTFTGQSQAGWTIASNDQYVVIAGEFPSVNGTSQQGLVRMAVPSLAPNTQGPRLSGATWQSNAIGLGGGRVRVAWQSNWDPDDYTLNYRVTRNGTVVNTSTASATFWNRPMLGFVDTGLTPGESYSYRVEAMDGHGNVQRTNIITVTVPSAASMSAYAQSVLDDGAGIFWRMGETGGTSEIDYAGFTDGTVGTGVTRGATGMVSGNADTASTFSGTPAGLISTPTAVPGPNTFTTEAWIRTTSTSGGKIVGFGNTPSGDSSSYDRHTYMDGDGRIWFGMFPGGVRTVNSAPGYNDGQWHQVVSSLGADGMQLYVDGVRVGQAADVTAGQDYSGYWRVGGDNLGGWPNAGSNYFSGDVDEVAIYPTVLTRAQIQAHFVASGRTLTGSTTPSDAYGAAVYQAQPDLYWRLGESSGTTAADSSGNNDAGSLNGGVSTGRPGVLSGVADTAFGFDGSSGGVSTSTPVAGPSAYSEELWFNTTTDRGGKLIGFGNAQTGLSSSYDRHVWMTDTGTIVFGTYTGQLNTVQSPAGFNDGKWHHMVATQNGSGMKLYLDGTLVGTDPQTGAQDYSGYWRIGGDVTWFDATSPYFAGTLDEVAVYGAALTQAQVTQHWQLGSGDTPNQPPTAAFTSSAQNLVASFDAGTSADADGTIASYAWSWGDNTADGAGVTQAHTYAAAGPYTVKLTVTDNKGATDTATRQITVSAANVPPVAAFTSAQADLKLSVDASTSSDPDGTIASYAWSWGDNTADGAGVTQAHTYAAAGPYTVKLTVTDNQGGTKSVSKSVTVMAPANQLPVAAFTSTQSDLALSVDGSTSSDPDGTIANYAWSWGDNTADGGGATVSHAYAAAGPYTVTLTVTDNQGATKSVSKPVTLTAAAGPQVVVADTFTRTAANSWGTADSGGVWTPSLSSSLSTNGSTGRIRAAAAAGPLVALAGVSERNVDGLLDFTTDKAPTGGGMYVNALLRRTGAGDYRVKARAAAGNSVQLLLTKLTGSSEVTLGSTTVAGLTFAAGTQIRLAFEVRSTSASTTALSAKAWTVGGTEPTGWQLTRNDTTPALQVAGSFGLQGYVSGSATNAPVVFSFDNLQLRRLPA